MDDLRQRPIAAQLEHSLGLEVVCGPIAGVSGDNRYSEVTKDDNLPEVIEENLPEVIEENFPELVRPAGSNSDSSDNPKYRALFCGLGKRTLYTIIGLCCLIMLGIGLGVGLGVGLRESRRNTSALNPGPSSLSISVMSWPTAASFISSTSSSIQPAVSSGTKGLTASPCSGDDVGISRNYTSSNDKSEIIFTEQCYVDWPAGFELFTGQGVIEDVRITVAYNFNSCINQCVAYNSALTSDNVLKCNAVIYNWNLTEAYLASQGNCFMKNGRGKSDSIASHTVSAYIV